MADCYEAKERKIDARPRTPKNWSRITWNTARIFQGRERGRCLPSFASVERSVSGRLPRLTAFLPIPLRKKMRM